MQSNNERKINNCLVVATIVYFIRIGFNTVCIWLNISPDNNVNVMGILFVCQNVLHWCCDYKIDNVALVKTNHILNRTYEIAEMAVFTMGQRFEHSLFLYSMHNTHIYCVLFCWYSFWAYLIPFGSGHKPRNAFRL